MVLFVVWFSAYGIRLHDAHLTHKSDLGQMDQAIWNTAHGRFVEMTKGVQLSTRMTDHVEPIFLPVSLVFWVWDDVRALLALQAAFLAAGAWPVYLFARRKLAAANLGVGAEWGAGVFAAAYLLMPALQAATVAEFHAMPLAAPLIAAALWALEERRWGGLVLWSLLVMAVQEGAALLGAALGAYAAVCKLCGCAQKPDFPQEPGFCAHSRCLSWRRYLSGWPGLVLHNHLRRYSPLCRRGLHAGSDALCGALMAHLATPSAMC